MDKEHARFVLRCFRPDGADAGDTDFAGALRLAAEDRELGEWLARERADDAAFSASLDRVPIPGDLREEILAGLAAERGETTPAADPLDAPFIGALATIEPPPFLRDRILAAMAAPLPAVRKRFPWFRVGLPTAAAAGIALAFLPDRGPSPDSASALPPTEISVAKVSQRVPLESVKAGFIQAYESQSLILDRKNPDHEALFTHLKSKALPCPGCHCLPAGLKEAPGIGCRELVVNGKRGSILCFDRGKNGVVHLVIFRRKDISGDLPCSEHPRLSREKEWASACWADEDDVFMLIGATDEKSLSALF